MINEPGSRDFDDLQYAIDLEVLARLSAEERADVAVWHAAEIHAAKVAHYEAYHGPDASFPGIYSCCILPRHPGEFRASA